MGSKFLRGHCRHVCSTHNSYKLFFLFDRKQQILGPRRGRFHDVQTGERLDVPKSIPGHSVSLQMLGTLILWFGWYGFNCGSALLLSTEHGDVLAGLAATTTTLSGGTAGITVLFANWIITRRVNGEGKYDLVKTMNGTVRSFRLKGKRSFWSP